MNRIDFTQLNGFGATQKTWDFVQESYRDLFSAIASLLGDNVIVSGMQEVGASVGDGWVVLNGELLPFSGGLKQDSIVVTEDVGSARFFDDSYREVYFTRYAQFGVAVDSVEYSSLLRLDNYKLLNSGVNTLAASLDQLAALFSSHVESVNPHQITKGTVGLDAIPNAVTSAVDDDSIDKLATASAVYQAVQMIGNSNRVLYAGTMAIGDVNVDKLMTVNHNQDIQVPYVVMGMLRGKSPVWDDDNDVIVSVRSISPNSFQVALRDVTKNVNNIDLDYVLIRKN